MFKRRRLEIYCNFLIWICAVLYSAYNFHKTNEKDYDENYPNLYNDFGNGWTFLNRKQDISDYEWNMIKNILKQIVPWIVIHLLVAELIRKKNIQNLFLKLWYILWGLTYVTFTFNYKVTIFLLAQPMFYEILHQIFKNDLILLWSLNLCWIIGINYVKTFDPKDLNLKLSHIQFSIIISASYWISLRCLFFYLHKKNTNDKNKVRIKERTKKTKGKSEETKEMNDKIKEGNEKLKEMIQKQNHRNKIKETSAKINEFLNCLTYCFYLPTLFTGPFIAYKDFEECFEESNVTFAKRLSILLLNVTRFVFWLLFVEFMLHFVYISVYVYYPEKVFEMNRWALYGYGYCMGQFFHMKYVVMYGLSTSFSKFENINIPKTPKCIGRIHLYSDMWKYFDCGLYKFLLSCIYIPTLKNKNSIINRLFSCLLCFFYVYVWHGLQMYVLVWSFFNYVGITIELLFKKIYEKFLKIFVKNNFNSIWERRLICIASSPLLAFSAISNFYFFAGTDVDGFRVNLVLLFALYNCCQISTEIKLWEAKKQI